MQETVQGKVEAGPVAVEETGTPVLVKAEDLVMVVVVEEEKEEGGANDYCKRFEGEVGGDGQSSG